MKKILVVDDDDFIREGLVKFLQRQGKKAVGAATGMEAIKTYKETNFDCVFLDINLTDLNGLEVFKIIKEYDPNAKVYFLSACSNAATKEKAVSLGAQGFITKPVNLPDLLDLI